MKIRIIALITSVLFALILCGVVSAAEANYTTFSNETIGANAITLDSQGNVYITGSTSNPNFPKTNGTYTSDTTGCGDIFVSKYTSNGTLIFSTYFGGSDNDAGSAIALDNQGNIYITGTTNSTNFPTTTGSGLNGALDAFIVKLSADGSTLLYSTYFGGSSTTTKTRGETGSKIAVDSQGNVYIIGQTDSTDFPTTAGAYKTEITSSGGVWGDVFLTKFNSNWELIYCTLLGGNTADETPYGIVIDSQGNVWITGKTGSSDFSTTTGANQTSLKGTSDAFISKFSPNGALIYSSYFGSAGTDYGYAIAIDGTDNIYITGQTSGKSTQNLPITKGAYQESKNGTSTTLTDAYVAKFNSSGSLVYCTYFGGSGTDDSRAIAVDNQGNVYITGRTGGTIPTTANAIQTIRKGTWDAFVAKLNSNGSALLYGTLLGGNGNDLGKGIEVDSLGNVYVTGDLIPLTKIATAPTVNINPTGGLFNTTPSITLTTSDSTDTIYYTTDGSNPTTSSTRSTYNSAIPIINTTTLKYAAVDNLGNWSPVYTETYTLKSNVFVQITPSKTNPQVGDKVTYTFKLGNNGPGIAKDVVFTYVIPEGVEFAGANVDQGTWTYNATTRTLTWNVGDVIVKPDPYLWLDLRILSAGSFNIHPLVSVAGYDPGLESNIGSLLVNAVSVPTNTVNAATRTIPMHDTGVPLTGLTMALLLVGSGLALARRK